MEKNRRQFLRQLAGIGGYAGLTGMPSLASAAVSKTQVQDIRLSRNLGYLRLVFDLDKSVKHSVFTLDKPNRVVLDLKNTAMSHGLVDQVPANALIRGIRSGIRNGHDLRVVFDLDGQVNTAQFYVATRSGLGPSPGTRSTEFSTAS